jgi:hypothetical protein
MAGYGDELIATGLARGAADRGRRVAFGDGRRILWGPHSAEVFKGNPNIAPPGSERAADIEWVDYYKGHRLYNVGHGTHWVWNYQFRPQPGELFFSPAEIEFAECFDPGFVVVEPNVPWHKPQAANKDWGFSKYERVAGLLRKAGREVVQFAVGRDRLSNVRTVTTPSFRHSLAVLRRAALVITPEGGLHHGAAATGTPAVVLFGGFIPPEATGYAMHANLTAGGAKACGLLSPCRHCRAAMDSISVDEVMAAAERQMAKSKALVSAC